MNFDIYCDESRPDLLSSENPTSKFMVIGSLWLKTDNRLAYKHDIHDLRDKHPEKNLAQLYDPDKMPEGLRDTHRLNDSAIERCYRSKPFGSDEKRLEYLFKLYEKMIAEEKEQGTLFAKESLSVIKAGKTRK